MLYILYYYFINSINLFYYSGFVVSSNIFLFTSKSKSYSINEFNGLYLPYTSPPNYQSFFYNLLSSNYFISSSLFSLFSFSIYSSLISSKTESSPSFSTYSLSSSSLSSSSSSSSSSS